MLSQLRHTVANITCYAARMDKTLSVQVCVLGPDQCLATVNALRAALLPIALDASLVHG